MTLGFERLLVLIQGGKARDQCPEPDPPRRRSLLYPRFWPFIYALLGVWLYFKS